MRLDPAGRFFLRRVLQDDLSNKVEPGSALEPYLAILRVAEAIAVGLSIVRALSAGEPGKFGIGFRWEGLTGHELVAWANPMPTVAGSGKARVNEITTFVEVAADTPLAAIGPLVEQATRDLFAVFDGEVIPLQTIEHWTAKLVDRRL